MSIADSMNIWAKRRAFNKVRHGFYRDLGAALNAEAPLNDLVYEYAHQGIPAISPMMMLWLEGLQVYPDSLTRATDGLVEEGDTVIIAAAEMNPRGAGELYGHYAKNLAQRASMIKALVAPLIIPAFTFVFLIGILFFFRHMIYADMVKGVPLQYWPGYAAFSYKTVMFLTGTGGLVILLTIIGFLAWIVWSIKNLTGPMRTALDRKVFPYTTIAHMELLSSLIAISSMIKAGVADTSALDLVSSRGSKWMAYQMDRIRAYTTRGKTVLTSLRDLPLPKMLAARVFVLARQERLANGLPALVIDSCMEESAAMVGRIQTVSKMVMVMSVLILLAFVCILMLGNIGYAEASQNMNDVLARGR